MTIPVNAIAQALFPLRQRLQMRDSLKAGWITFSTGLGLTAILLMTARWRPVLFNWQMALLGLSLTLFLMCLGQVIAWFRPISLPTLARLGDARLKLDERLITALELAENRLDTSPHIRQAQLADAVARLRGASLNAAFPLLPAYTRLIAALTIALIAVVVALTLTPNPQEKTLQTQAELAQFLETEIAELQQIQADLLAQPDSPAAERVEELSATLAELIDRLETARQNLSAEEALAAMAEAEEALAQPDEQAQALTALQESLGQPAAADLAGAQEAGQAGQPAQKTAQTLEQMAANLPAGAEAQAQTAEALAQAANAVAQTNPELAKTLAEASQALQNGNTQAAQNALNQAADQVTQMSDTQNAAQAQQAAAQALANIQQARAQMAGQTGPGANQGAGQAQTNGQGTGQAQGTTNQGQGGGSGQGEAGPGADGLYSVNGAGTTKSDNNRPDQNRLEDYNAVYAPQHIGGEGGDFVTPDQQANDGGGTEIGQSAPNPNRDPGQATVPYTEVYQQYAEQAGMALDSDYIPLGMKDYVRQYFGALEP